MKWFKNLKISVKLMSAFMAIALIACGVGVFGLISLTNANSESVFVFKNYGASQGYLGHVLGEFNNQRTLYQDIISLADNGKTAEYVGKINASSEIMMDNLKKFQQTCTTQDEQVEYFSLERDINNYITVRDEIIAAAQKGDYDTANTILRQETAAKVVSNTQATIDSAILNNTKTADTKLNAEDASVKTSAMILIILVAAAVLLAAGLSLFITHIIAKPIKDLALSADLLAEGDTTIKKVSFSQKDEVGQIYNSMRGILDAVVGLTTEIERLTVAATNGDLSARADATGQKGDYRRIIEGINGMLDAVINPVKDAVTVIEEISNGNLDIYVTADYKGDLACIKIALNHTVDEFKKIIGEMMYALSEISSGNLDIEITTECRGSYIQLRDSINGIIASLNDTLTEINMSADQVASGARQVSDGVQETSQGATEQASAIEELTATVEQIAEQTKQNAMSANKANELTLTAKGDAGRGNEQMKAMQQAMAEINEASQSISKIIRVIDDIAFQTNILALNAAVEAARAGIHGKGFAVVAEEVRNLAARSANAAKETTDLIEGSISKTEAGMKITNETAAALSSIVSAVDNAARLVSEIAAASNEQAGAITQVNRGIEQMSRVVQTNSATAQEGAAASEELSSQAELLKNMVSKFQLKKRADVQRTFEEKAPEEETWKSWESDAPKRPVIKFNDEDFGKY